MGYLYFNIKNFVKLQAKSIVTSQKAAADSCCNVCDESKGFIKAYSIDHFFNMCGECCLQPGDFWKYKIFEFGLTKVDDAKSSPCSDAGFTNFYETDTHGVPGLITMVLDMYKKPASEDDSVAKVAEDKLEEIADRIDKIDLKKTHHEVHNIAKDALKDGLDRIINGN